MLSCILYNQWQKQKVLTGGTLLTVCCAMQAYRKSAKIYYMPVWTMSELETLFKAKYEGSRDGKDVWEMYRHWGGCVRWVLEKPREDSERLLFDSVEASNADKLMAACIGSNDDAASSSPVSSFLFNIVGSCYVPLWVVRPSTLRAAEASSKHKQNFYPLNARISVS